MQKTIVADATKCTGCRTCELVCSVKKEGMANPARARIRVVRFDSIVFEVPVFCQQCASAPCLAICPVKAISRDKKTGVLNVNNELCIGCKMCLTVCPFGAMNYDPVGKKVFKCDQCGGEPTCVKFCETKALEYVDITAVSARKSRDSALKFSDVARKFSPELTRAE